MKTRTEVKATRTESNRSRIAQSSVLRTQSRLQSSVLSPQHSALASVLRTQSWLRQPWSAVLALLVIIVWLSACTPQDNRSAGTDKVRIAFAASPDSALVQIAQVQGYFRREGLDAALQMHPYGKVALRNVLDGNADFATVAETPTMFAVLKGEQIAVIATIVTSRRNTAVIARKERGIHAPPDLKKKKIAATFGTISEFFLDSFLVTHGIAKAEVKVVNLPPEELVAAMAAGEVDAVSAFTPFTAAIETKLGASVVTFHDEEIYTQTFNIVAKTDFIRRNPGTVKRLIRGLIKAEDFLSAHPAESQKIIADFSRLDQAVVEQLWPDVDFGVSLDQQLILALEDEARWAIRNRLTAAAEIPNFLNYVYFDGLMSVNPRAVRILR